jgi:hypothetical protein
VENELARHDPLKHIAIQILEFSLSFESSPTKVKSIVKDALVGNKQLLQQCQAYAAENGFENIDYLLERMIYRDDGFNALVIIDEVPDELETVLVKKFKFPVEVLSLQRFVSESGERIYKFEPFLAEIGGSGLLTIAKKKSSTITVDPLDIDTIVVPAREEGFQEVFLGENCWYSIRIHSSMIARIKYLAAYQVAPIAAITHVAKVDKIEQWKDSSKYILYFEKAARPMGSLKLVHKGLVKAPQSARYTSLERLESASTLDEAF